MSGGKTTSSFLILYDQLRWEEKSLIEYTKKRGIDAVPLNCREITVDLNKKNDYENKTILQRCTSYFNNLHSTAAIEGLGGRVINSLHTAIFCGNKLFTHMELLNSGIQTPLAFCAFSESSALSSLNKYGYPKIIKPVIGSWGRLIALLKDKESAEGIIEGRQHMYPLYHIYYFEEMVNRPPRDIRAIVIGEQVVAAIYRYSAPSEWKTNMALGGRAESCKVTQELEEVCLKASRSVNGQIVGVDLMESDEKGFTVHEVNNTTEFKNTVRVTGVDIPSLMVEYILHLDR